MDVELEWIGAIKQSLDVKPNHSLTSAQLSVHYIWWKTKTKTKTKTKSELKTQHVLYFLKMI